MSVADLTDPYVLLGFIHTLTKHQVITEYAGEKLYWNLLLAEKGEASPLDFIVMS
jgi:hypothetical protein